MEIEPLIILRGQNYLYGGRALIVKSYVKYFFIILIYI